ncbi:MAG: hypothetical protein WCY92_04395 [Novosphingobium sp.]
MSAHVLIVVLFGAVLAVIGFTMAFRQAFVRRLLGRSRRSPSQLSQGNGDEDPSTYILRIAGIMIMVFGIALGGMMTLFHTA